MLKNVLSTGTIGAVVAVSIHFFGGSLTLDLLVGALTSIMAGFAAHAMGCCGDDNCKKTKNK